MSGKDITFKTDDFLTPKVSKKRKLPEEKGTSKRQKNTSWRGTMSVQLKSANSINSEFKKKTDKLVKQKSTVVNESLSSTVGDADNLLFFNSAIQPSFLTAAEIDTLNDRIGKFKKAYNELPSIVKLYWKDRDGAFLLGMRAKSEVKIESNATSPQTCNVAEKDEIIWMSSAASLEKISIDNIKGNKFCCVVPNYKGVIRVTINNTGSGANGLQIK